MATDPSSIEIKSDSEPWSILENLVLAQAIYKCGDTNWVAIARTIKAHPQIHRTSSFFSQKVCMQCHSMFCAVFFSFLFLLPYFFILVSEYMLISPSIFSHVELCDSIYPAFREPRGREVSPLIGQCTHVARTDSLESCKLISPHTVSHFFHSHRSKQQRANEAGTSATQGSF